MDHGAASEKTAETPYCTH